MLWHSQEWKNTRDIEETISLKSLMRLHKNSLSEVQNTAARYSIPHYAELKVLCIEIAF